MVEISAFKGLIYNKQKIEKLDDVMSPPYDIISEKMQNELYEKNDNNFVRLILGKQFDSDDDNDNRYTRAKKLYEEWQKSGILAKSEKEAIFPYKVEYKVNGNAKIMSGFFTLLKIDPDYKLVKAHERTLSKPKADRLNLMRACKSNLEPIQLLYIDEKDEIKKLIDSKIKYPEIDVKGYDGFNHKLWKIENENVISKIKDELRDEILFIADGHHRYQTAINFANEMKEKTKDTDENAPFNYRMVILANMFDEGLLIYPTHRLIKMENINIKDIIDKSKEFFEIEEKTIDDSDFEKAGKKIIKDIKTKDDHKFALYIEGKYYIFTLKDESSMNRFASDRTKTWRTLDVSILHKILLEHVIGINQDNLEDHVKYTRVDSEAIELVKQGSFNASVLMNPTRIEELKAIADAGEHMPQKSTYFLPKMLSGLVMYKMQ